MINSPPKNPRTRQVFSLYREEINNLFASLRAAFHLQRILNFRKDEIFSAISPEYLRYRAFLCAAHSVNAKRYQFLPLGREEISFRHVANLQVISKDA
jgi:hypothetical protein